MDFKLILKKSLPYLTGIALFFIISFLYLKPVFNGYQIKQVDYVNFVGGSNDLYGYHERTDKEPLWTESMFSGMPATQIIVFDKGNNTGMLLDIITLGLPAPVSFMFLGFLGFFILALCLKINPWVGMIGAVAFGLSTYSIILFEVGHITKIIAIVFMAPVIGAFILSYRRNLFWGFVLSAIFMALELIANHVQITYYLGMILATLGIYELVKTIRKKTYKQFAFATLAVVFAYGLAFLSSSANLLPTKAYAKYSIRGANDISIKPDLTPNHANSTTGLDKDYITAWSNGKMESLTFFIPFAKGGETQTVANGSFADKVLEGDYTRNQREYINGSNQYWANQPFTSGPVYYGALVFFLAILGLFFVKSKIKWALFAISLLTLMLSWGKNLMWLTDFFLEYLPLYSKFRAVSIILVVMQVTIPLIAMLFLNELWKNKAEILAQKKKFYLVSGGFIGIMLLLIAFPSMTGLYSKAEKKQLSSSDTQIEASVRQQVMQIPKQNLAQYGVNPNDPASLESFIQKATQQQIEFFQNNFPALKSFRASVFRESAGRSLIFIVLGVLLILFTLRSNSKNSKLISFGGIGVLILIDLVGVDLKFLNQDMMDRRDEYEQWELSSERKYPLSPTAADQQILSQEMAVNPKLENAVIKAKQEAQKYAREKEFSRIAQNNYIQNERFRTYNRLTHFRVANLTENVFNSSRNSYFHESIGGYHGAKLRRYQNMIEFGYLPSNIKILGMLNAKYIVRGSAETPNVSVNPFALGNAWLVKDVHLVKNNNEAILSLGNQYQIKAQNGWNVFVNGVQKNTTTVYGRENIVAVKNQDSVQLNFPSGLKEGLEASFVKDVNGNTNWIPAATLANDTANSFSTIIAMKVTNSFEPREEAIVLEQYKNYLGGKTSFTAKGSVKLIRAELNDLKYSFNSKSDQLMVFSEVYYPIGWKAKIDNKPAEYIPVNYLLRGIKVPKGKHTIEFYFEDELFNTGLIVANISSWIIVLLFFGALGKEIYDRTKKKSSQQIESE